jgi:hypothetical protein
MHLSCWIAGILSVGDNPENKNPWRSFSGAGDIGCSTGKSSGLTLLHLVCQQNIGDFRLRPCTLLRWWHEAVSSCQWIPGLYENWDRNSLLLNVGKCKPITFARSRHPAWWVLIHDGWDRARSSDLGVIMDEKMTFSEHVDVMVAKAFAMLGFIRRFSLEFRDSYTLKSLCMSLVRPKLEYASCVWN